MACVPPAPLLCTAFWVWTDQPLCSVMPHSPGEQANEGVIGGRRSSSSSMRERERRRSAFSSFAAPVCLFSSELKINSKTGAGDCSQSWFHLFYSCCWLTCDIGACSLEHGKVQCLRKGQAALHSYPHPPSSLSTVICSFLWMLIFSDLHIFDLNHSRLALFPFYFRLSLPLTIHISFFFFVTLVAVLFRNGSTENRPVTLRSQTASSARVAHAQRTAEATRNLCPPPPEPFWPQGLSYHKL